MFDTIAIGTSGLQAFSNGLKVISNNVTNLNTVGFKASDLRFSNLYYQPGDVPGANAGTGFSLFGTGVLAGETFVNFAAGDTRQTGNPLDVSIDGAGFFVTRQPGDANAAYTRAGQFEFDKNGVLVVRGTTRQVMALGGAGDTNAITLNGLRINAPKPTATVKLGGNLSSAATTFTIDAVTVIDALGASHVLKLVFTANAASAGSWNVAVTDGSSDVGSGEVRFVGGIIDTAFDKISFSYAPEGTQAQDITIDLSSGVTSFSSGTTSSLAVASTDGHAVGALTTTTFDAKGVLTLTYSNGETATGPQLALAVFDDMAGLRPADDGSFTADSTQQIHVGAAGTPRFGSIQSNQVEGSNVDLSAEFSNLIVMQRGYQAASRIVSTASDMLQELFDMKGSR